MPFGIGIWELAILVAIVLLVAGPKQGPKLMRSFGRGMREARDVVTTPQREIKKALTMAPDDEREQRSDTTT